MPTNGHAHDHRRPRQLASSPSSAPFFHPITRPVPFSLAVFPGAPLQLYSDPHSRRAKWVSQARGAPLLAKRRGRNSPNRPCGSANAVRRAAGAGHEAVFPSLSAFPRQVRSGITPYRISPSFFPSERCRRVNVHPQSPHVPPKSWTVVSMIAMTIGTSSSDRSSRNAPSRRPATQEASRLPSGSRKVSTHGKVLQHIRPPYSRIVWPPTCHCERVTTLSARFFKARPMKRCPEHTVCCSRTRCNHCSLGHSGWSQA
jgi:hypothetical protein